MSQVEEFLKLLESTIRAPRLSGSKVTQLSNLSKTISSEKETTKIISSFLKLNNSLDHGTQARISSLYAFDAIARANKGVKGQEGLMMKMEGVVDSWIGGLVDDGKGGVFDSGKEKARKIVDIWKKGSTFPPACLERLIKRLEASTTPPISTTPPMPPISPALPPLETDKRAKSDQGTTSTPPVAAGSLPPEIQALLGIQAQAAQNAANGQSSATTAPGGVDIASILAGIKPATPTIPDPGQGSATSLASVPALNAGSVPIVPALPSFNPAQLAALANLAKIQAPTGSAPFAVQSPPQHAASFSPLHMGSTGQAGPSISGGSGGPSGFAAPMGGFPTQQGGPSNYDRPPPPRGNGPDHHGSGGYGGNTGGYGFPGGPPGPPRRGSRDGDVRGYNQDRYGHPDRQNSFGNASGSGGHGGTYQRNRSRSPPRRQWGESDRAEPMGGWRNDRPPQSDLGGSDVNRGNQWNDGDRGDRGERGRGRGGGGGRGRGIGRDGPPGRDFGSDRPRGDQGWGHARGGSREFNSQPNNYFPPAHGAGVGTGSQQRQNPSQPFSTGPVGDTAMSAQSTGRRAPVPLQPGKDEFGRDLPADRAEVQTELEDGEEDMALDNSDDEAAPSGKASAPTASIPPAFGTSTPGSSLPAPPSQTPLNPPNQNTIPHNSNANAKSGGYTPMGNQQTQRQRLTLETFDRSTFDGMNPASWASLGEAFEASMGRQPDQMELMQFLAMGMVGNQSFVSGGGGNGGGHMMGGVGGGNGAMGGMGGMGGGMGGMAGGMGGMNGKGDTGGW